MRDERPGGPSSLSPHPSSLGKSRFPDPRDARGDIIALGADLTVDTLRDAYRHGIFPWPHDGLVLPWFSPRRRTVIFFDDVHVSRSLRKRRAQVDFRFTIDRAFPDVIRACSDMARPGQDGTWILPEMIQAYTKLHEAGDVHSVEVWNGEALVGGLYGVDAGGVFTGESMFYRESGASKLALLHLIDHLAARGSKWLDCQTMTPHMRALGARDIPRARFLDLLEKAQNQSLDLF